MRTHIKHLASKEYQTITGSDLDHVIMFVPIEGALAAARYEEMKARHGRRHCN